MALNRTSVAETSSNMATERPSTLQSLAASTSGNTVLALTVNVSEFNNIRNVTMEV